MVRQRLPPGQKHKFLVSKSREDIIKLPPQKPTKSLINLPIEEEVPSPKKSKHGFVWSLPRRQTQLERKIEVAREELESKPKWQQRSGGGRPPSKGSRAGGEPSRRSPSPSRPPGRSYNSRLRRGRLNFEAGLAKSAAQDFSDSKALYYAPVTGGKPGSQMEFLRSLRRYRHINESFFDARRAVQKERRWRRELREIGRQLGGGGDGSLGPLDDSSPRAGAEKPQSEKAEGRGDPPSGEGEARLPRTQESNISEDTAERCNTAEEGHRLSVYSVRYTGIGGNPLLRTTMPREVMKIQHKELVYALDNLAADEPPPGVEPRLIRNQGVPEVELTHAPGRAGTPLLQTRSPGATSQHRIVLGLVNSEIRDAFYRGGQDEVDEIIRHRIPGGLAPKQEPRAKPSPKRRGAMGSAEGPAAVGTPKGGGAGGANVRDSHSGEPSAAPCQDWVGGAPEAAPCQAELRAPPTAAGAGDEEGGEGGQGGGIEGCTADETAAQAEGPQEEGPGNAPRSPPRQPRRRSPCRPGSSIFSRLVYQTLSADEIPKGTPIWLSYTIRSPEPEEEEDPIERLKSLRTPMASPLHNSHAAGARTHRGEQPAGAQGGSGGGEEAARRRVWRRGAGTLRELHIPAELREKMPQWMRESKEPEPWERRGGGEPLSESPAPAPRSPPGGAQPPSPPARRTGVPPIRTLLSPEPVPGTILRDQTQKQVGVERDMRTQDLLLRRAQRRLSPLRVPNRRRIS